MKLKRVVPVRKRSVEGKDARAIPHLLYLLYRHRNDVLFLQTALKH